MNDTTTDLIIVGAGIPGLTLALLTADMGLTVALVDPVPLSSAPRETDTRTSALMTGSLTLLDKAGLHDEIKTLGEDLKILRIINDSDKISQGADVLFRAVEIGQERFGRNLPNSRLRKLLADRAVTLDYITFYPAKLSSFETDDVGVTVTLDNDTSLRAKLLVGADGRNSPTRKGAGIAVTDKDYGQSAITCYIEQTLPHNNVSTEFHRPGGPFTLVPLLGKMSSVVWVEKTADAEKFIRLDRSSFENALQQRTKDCLGSITLARPPQSWPLISRTAKRFTGRRVALIGEAAHVVTPLGAQGLNMSLRDVDALAKVISDGLYTGLDFGQKIILRSYEQTRQSDVRMRTHSVNMLNRLVSQSSTWAALARNIGLKTLGTASPLKEAIMKYGLAPPLPDSLKDLSA